MLLAAVAAVVFVGAGVWPFAAGQPVAIATTGQTLWVDGSSAACSDGQDRATDPARPWCTVTRAAAQASPGDTVHIRAGRYPGVVRPARSGLADAPIQFVAESPDVVLDATGAANAVRVIAVDHVGFSGMQVTGGANQGVWVE